MRKDFKNIDIYAAFQPTNGAEWQKANGSGIRLYPHLTQLLHAITSYYFLFTQF